MAKAKECDSCSTLYRLEDIDDREYSIVNKAGYKVEIDLCNDCYKDNIVTIAEKGDVVNIDVTKKVIKEKPAKRKYQKKDRKYVKYTEEIFDFAKNNIDDMNNPELSKAINDRFGVATTVISLSRRLSVKGIKRKYRPSRKSEPVDTLKEAQRKGGKVTAERKGRHKKITDEQIIEEIKKLKGKGLSARKIQLELQEKLGYNIHFNTILNYWKKIEKENLNSDNKYMETVKAETRDVFKSVDCVHQCGKQTTNQDGECDDCKKMMGSV